jgi:hypothetical protein
MMTEIKRVTIALINRTDDQETLESITSSLIAKLRWSNPETLTYQKLYSKLQDTVEKLSNMGAIDTRAEVPNAWENPFSTDCIGDMLA